ncbi:MAG: GPW/gp25 family protein [Bacteroidota bacterium]
MEKDKAFLGSGWSFPPRFNKKSGTVDLVHGETDIGQSLDILLSTSLGERVMQAKYGCNLQDYLYEPLNVGVTGFLKDLVENAILLFEPRIFLENVTVTPANSLDMLAGKFTISVDYRIQETNSRANYVYDFYLNEANQPI